MSSQKVVGIPVRTSSIPKVTLSHSNVLTKLPVKKVEKKEAFGNKVEKKEAFGSKVEKKEAVGSKVSCSKDVTTKEANFKAKTNLVPPAATSKSLWQTAKSFGKVAPSKVMITLRERSNNKKGNKQMVSSTGTESSGVFSDSDNGENVPSAPVKPVRPSTASSQTSSSRVSSTLGRSTSKPVKRPALNNGKCFVFM